MTDAPREIVTLTPSELDEAVIVKLRRGVPKKLSKGGSRVLPSLETARGLMLVAADRLEMAIRDRDAWKSDAISLQSQLASCGNELTKAWHQIERAEAARAPITAQDALAAPEIATLVEATGTAATAMEHALHDDIPVHIEQELLAALNGILAALAGLGDKA